MGRRDWFRNESWNAKIEETFFENLARSKNKSQYLRIQASILRERHPGVALRLLDQYFAIGEAFSPA